MEELFERWFDHEKLIKLADNAGRGRCLLIGCDLPVIGNSPFCVDCIAQLGPKFLSKIEELTVLLQKYQAKHYPITNEQIQKITASRI